MNLVISSTYYLPYISGLTRYAERLGKTLTKQGHKVKVVCVKHDPELGGQEDLGGIEVIRTSPGVKLSKGFISSDWLINAQRYIKNSDGVFINLPQAEGVWAAIVARWYGKPIWVIYNCELARSGGLINQLIQHLVNFSGSLSCRMAKKIVVYTEDYARASKILLPLLNKCAFILPPIEKPAVKNERKIIKIMAGEQINIGVAARLSAEKGVEYLMEAIPYIQKEWPSFKIWIAGPTNPVGEEKYRSYITQLVRKWRGIIHFLGTLTPGEMTSYYKQLDVLVLPSVSSTEAFGMVQAEAMLNGVGVVSTNLPGVRVPIQITQMGVTVAPKDARAIAEGITQVIKNKNVIRAKVKVAQKIFNRKEFDQAYAQLLN